jgi:hypothetical protein
VFFEPTKRDTRDTKPDTKPRDTKPRDTRDEEPRTANASEAQNQCRPRFARTLEASLDQPSANEVSTKSTSFGAVWLRVSKVSLVSLVFRFAQPSLSFGPTRQPVVGQGPGVALALGQPQPGTLGFAVFCARSNARHQVPLRPPSVNQAGLHRPTWFTRSLSLTEPSLMAV